MGFFKNIFKKYKTTYHIISFMYMKDGVMVFKQTKMTFFEKQTYLEVYDKIMDFYKLDDTYQILSITEVDHKTFKMYHCNEKKN